MTDGPIGVPRPRLDAPQKVTGTTRYAADTAVPGLLHARLVSSWEAHALVERIDTEAAVAVPGVVACLTAADLPIAAEGTSRSIRRFGSHEDALNAPTLTIQYTVVPEPSTGILLLSLSSAAGTLLWRRYRSVPRL